MKRPWHVADRRTRCGRNFDELTSETLDFGVELTHLPPKIARRSPEFLACGLGCFCPSSLALTIVQDSRDSACENIPAFFDPLVDSPADFNVLPGVDTHRLPIRGRIATTRSALGWPGDSIHADRQGTVACSGATVDATCRIHQCSMRDTMGRHTNNRGLSIRSVYGRGDICETF